MTEHTSIPVEVLPPETQPKRHRLTVFEPFFAPKAEVTAIKRTQTIGQQQKWRLYFAAHGCLHCHQRIYRHLGCGHCTKCYYKVSARLNSVDRNMSLYFEQYGCLHCQQKIARHAGFGHCAACYSEVASRLRTVILWAERETCKKMPATMDMTKIARQALAPSIRKLGGGINLLPPERRALPQ